MLAFAYLHSSLLASMLIRICICCGHSAVRTSVWWASPWMLCTFHIEYYHLQYGWFLRMLTPHTPSTPHTHAHTHYNVHRHRRRCQIPAKKEKYLSCRLRDLFAQNANGLCAKTGHPHTQGPSTATTCTILPHLHSNSLDRYEQVLICMLDY